MIPFLKNHIQIKLDEYNCKRYSDYEIMELIEIELFKRKVIIKSKSDNELIFLGGIFTLFHHSSFNYVQYATIKLIEKNNSKHLEYTYWTPFLLTGIIVTIIFLSQIPFSGPITIFGITANFVLYCSVIIKQKRFVTQLNKKIRNIKYGSSLGW